MHSAQTAVPRAKKEQKTEIVAGPVAQSTVLDGADKVPVVVRIPAGPGVKFKVISPVYSERPAERQWAPTTKENEQKLKLHIDAQLKSAI